MTYTCIVHFVPKPTVKPLWLGLYNMHSTDNVMEYNRLIMIWI